MPILTTAPAKTRPTRYRSNRKSLLHHRTLPERSFAVATQKIFLFQTPKMIVATMCENVPSDVNIGTQTKSFHLPIKKEFGKASEQARIACLVSTAMLHVSVDVRLEFKDVTGIHREVAKYRLNYGYGIPVCGIELGEISIGRTTSQMQPHLRELLMNFLETCHLVIAECHPPRRINAKKVRWMNRPGHILKNFFGHFARSVIAAA